MAPLGATPKTTLPSSSSWRASTLASKLVSIVPGCHKSHSEPSYDYDCQTSFSHERLFDSAGRVSQPGSQSRQARAALAEWQKHRRGSRGKHGKMATCHEKSRLLLSFFPFFSRAHTRKSQWVVTVTKYRSAIAAAHYIHTLLHTMLHI